MRFLIVFYELVGNMEEKEVGGAIIDTETADKALDEAGARAGRLSEKMGVRVHFRVASHDGPIEMMRFN